jgi:hypothetical protein
VCVEPSQKEIIQVMPEVNLLWSVCSQLRVKMVVNGRENHLTIFARISFYSVGNGSGKVRNEIRSVKSGPSKMDKSEQKCVGIKSANGNLNQKHDNIEK